jgi:hypothetical protein
VSLWGRSNIAERWGFRSHPDGLFGYGCLSGIDATDIDRFAERAGWLKGDGGFLVVANDISMMARRGVLGGAMALLTACDPFVRSASYRVRVTIAVDTPEGVKTGSSVWEIEAVKGTIKVGDVGTTNSGIAGEAVVVDLPDGPIFALLTIGDGQRSLQGAITDALVPGALKGDFYSAVASLAPGWFKGSVKAELPREYVSPNLRDPEPRWPMMVRFKDINNPRSVERVDPASIGVKRISLETTNDDMTQGIEKRFPPWFEEINKSHSKLSGNPTGIITGSSLDDILGPVDFGAKVRK